MFKLIIYTALVSTFFVTVHCTESSSSAESDSIDVEENENSGESCPKYEFYNKCPAVKCEADFCPRSRDDPQTCPIGIVCDPPRCVCMNNRRRDRKTGRCILIQTCPPFKCDGKNEVYDSCPGECPSEKCSDYVSKKPCGPPLGTHIDVVVPCKPQCRCKGGYYRNANGACVKPENCEPTCPKNEVYSTCTQGQCGPKTCAQLGQSLPCPRIDPKYCKKGCLCAEGYLRNNKGICIPKDQCPSSEGCGGDPNAVKTDCGTYCGHSCSDYYKADRILCAAVCNTSGCSCKTNYVYDASVKKCVKPEECKKVKPVESSSSESEKGEGYGTK